MRIIYFYKDAIPDYTEDELAVLSTLAFHADCRDVCEFSWTQLARWMGIAPSNWNKVKERLVSAVESLAQRRDLTHLSILSRENTRAVCQLGVESVKEQIGYVSLSAKEWIPINDVYLNGARYNMGCDLRLYLYLKSRRVYDRANGVDGCWAQSHDIQEQLDISAYKWQEAARRLNAVGALAWYQQSNGVGDEFDFEKTAQSARALSELHIRTLANLHAKLDKSRVIQMPKAQ